MDAGSPHAADSSPGPGATGSPAAPVWPHNGPPATHPPAAPYAQAAPGAPHQAPSHPAPSHQAPAAPAAPPLPASGGPSADAPDDGWDGAGDDETDLPPSGLWQKMKADPQYAPEHLALEAVQRLGPQAAAWAQRTRARYPGMPADTVAQIAVRRFTTFARLSGAAAGATGLPGAVIDIGVLAWTQARMVLHIAAAYGIDATDPERATDLLVLQNVHKYTQTARTALSVARGHQDASSLLSKGHNTPMSAVFAQLGWKLAQMAGVRAAKKVFAKMVPGAAIILGTWANSSATKDLARKTVALYRRPEQYQHQLPSGPS